MIITLAHAHNKFGKFLELQYAMQQSNRIESIRPTNRDDNLHNVVIFFAHISQRVHWFYLFMVDLAPLFFLLLSFWFCVAQEFRFCLFILETFAHFKWLLLVSLFDWREIMDTTIENEFTNNNKRRKYVCCPREKGKKCEPYRFNPKELLNYLIECATTLYNTHKYRFFSHPIAMYSVVAIEWECVSCCVCLCMRFPVRQPTIRGTYTWKCAWTVFTGVYRGGE